MAYQSRTTPSRKLKDAQAMREVLLLAS